MCRRPRRPASSGPEDPVRADALIAYKRAQVLLHPDGAVRFAGAVRSDITYRADDVFVCPRGHRRLEPSCSCGFYGLERLADLPPSVVTTAVLEVVFEGRVVRHRECLRAERQRVRRVTFDGWCSFCVAPAACLAGIASAWGELVEPWRRARPVCAAHARLYPLVAGLPDVALATGAHIGFQCSGESRAARSLRRQYRAAFFVH